MTALTRWNPLQDMQSIQQQFNQILEPFFRRGFDFGEELRSTGWVPPVDIEETTDRLILRAELPGFKPENVDIQFENGVLTLKGERRFENENQQKNFHRIERSYGTFVRTFALPGTVDAERTTASYKDGILELQMPKREEAKPRRIEINTPAKEIEK